MSCKKHVSYQDCISGKISTPTDPKQKTVFQVMMITCMVTVMVTFNWFIRHDTYNLEDFVQSLYLYPLTFGIALGVRFLVANPTIDQLIKKFITPNFEGAKRAMLATIVGVIFANTISSLLIMPIVYGGFDEITPSLFLLNLSISYCASFTFNYFVVGPLVKKIFEEKIRHHIPAMRNTNALKRWF